ncbi:MAG: hypothetical protein ACRDRG_08945 [Pseudonocardiaceae bacterium]
MLPNYSFADRPAMDAFLIPGGFGLRQEIRNARLQEFIRSLPEQTMLTSVCTGSWIYGQMGAARQTAGHQSQGAGSGRVGGSGQGAD